MKKRIKIIWTCSDYCKKEHKTKLTANLHGYYLLAKQKIAKIISKSS